ncbi:beta-glucosidase 24-like [Cornus florida]|uniref:beta-glucosidase 24-like n=1 Tax=Cornus florida TaxID=4283 RepID=UPI00289CA29C|nr:beta-glucosidase 24-like [Cornus florida]
MGSEGHILLSLIVFVHSVAHGYAGVQPRDDSENNIPFNRHSFPRGFVFGAASSAYQYEGAWNASGKGLNNWDHFTQTYPEMVKGNASGKVAVNFYDLYPEDFERMNDIGFDAVRISLSWSRILPSGRVNGGSGVNPDGLKYYHNLIDDTLSKGLKPFVTLFHFDMPQALQDEYGGFLDYKIVNDFEDYADLCFKEFGHKVQYWITINEPWSYSAMGYAYGSFPPGRCSKDENLQKSEDLYRVGRAFKSLFISCPVPGDSGTEPYNVTHHLLLAHAKAVQLYRNKYQRIQSKIMGKIGIVNVVQWMLPFDTQSKNDTAAANRALDFMYGWFMEPLNSGSYPSSMIEYVGDRLPIFTNRESKMVKGSSDFIGLNYYTAAYAYHVPCKKIPSYLTDSCSSLMEVNATGYQIGPKAGSDWLYVYPEGLGDLLNYTKNQYNNPKIYVTENGVDLINGYNIQHDSMRIKYHNDHLHVLRDVMKRTGVNVNGYFVWSFLDNFEWTEGYTVRFGLVYVNYFNKTLFRFSKDSASWFSNFLKNGAETLPKIPDTGLALGSMSVHQNGII